MRPRAIQPEGENNQRALVDALFDLNPSMNQIYPGNRRYICDVFRIESGEGEYFDLGQKPVFRRPFALGSAEVTPGTFEITDACTGCGICTSACPESCIREDSPFAIDQSHCLRCGICQEICPSKAVRKL